MKILMMGPQGSGKGTIGKMLSDALSVPTISVGQELRKVSVNSPYYEAINGAMEKGELAPYEETAEIIKERLSVPDCQGGYILDGWARNMDQLKYFNPDLDDVLYIDISKETSVKRISGRRICEKDGFTCNIYTLPPEHNDRCDKCGGELTQREDDTEEAVARRLQIFYNETMEVVEHYKKKGILHKIDGEGTPEEVFQDAMSALGIQND